MINNKLQYTFIQQNITYTSFSPRSALLKKLLNLARQNFTLKKSFKTLIFILKLRELCYLSLKGYLLNSLWLGFEQDSTGFEQRSANYLGSNRILRGSWPHGPPSLDRGKRLRSIITFQGDTSRIYIDLCMHHLTFFRLNQHVFVLFCKN